MKRIMLITPMLHQGGFERICVMTARLLSKKYDVVIAVFSMEDVAFDISGLKVIDLNIATKPGKLSKIINVLKRSMALTRLQKKLGTDISYSFGMTANIANALTWGAKKKLTACHSFEEIKSSFYMKLISRHSDKVLCCSKKMADLVESRYHFANVQALWNPCDIDGARKQSRETEGEDLSFFEGADKVLVSMGREDDVKGFWHLIKAFKRVNEQEKNTRLAIVGDGSFEEYKELARKLGIEDRVCFTGLKRNPFPYLKASDLYLLTSLSEGLPNALVEALSLSLPIVSVNCLSGPAEILHEDWKHAEQKAEIFKADYGVLAPVLGSEKNLEVEYEAADKTAREEMQVSASDVEDGMNGCCVKLEPSQEALAEAILLMLCDEELYKNYQNKAAKRAEDFSAENHIRELILCMEAL